MSRPSREGRPERIPVTASRAPLTVQGFDHQNFSGRWVNDVDDRIARFLDAGYEFITKDGVTVGEPTVDSSSGLDSRVSKPVGRGVRAYLMRLPRNLYNEDQMAKQREIDALDEAIRRPGKRGGPISLEVDYGEVSLESEQGDEKIRSRKFKR